MKYSNILQNLLAALGIPFTAPFSRDVFEKQPYKYSLYGLTHMLRTYRVKTTTLRLNDKDDISQLKPPFIAQVANDLAVITSVTKHDITYRWYDTIVNESLLQFNVKWSGVVLLASPEKNSEEPDYKRHLRDIRTDIFIRTLCICCALIFCLSGFFCTYTSPRSTALQLAVFIISILGAGFSYLLLSEQLRLNHSLTRQICKIGGHDGCRSVQNSAAAKLFGIFGWSEIGFSFFLVNALSALLLSQQLPYIAVITLPALPYTIWSVWYQRYKVHNWCPLCLLVQLVIWLLFATFIGFNTYADLQIKISTAFLLLASYGFLLALLHLFLPIFSQSRKSDNWKYSYLALKHRKEIFFNCLAQQPVIPTGPASTLYFGPENSEHCLTVFSNPYCNPCARLHEHLETLLDEGYRLQYVMTYFNDDLREVNRRIIATYHVQGANRTWKLLCDWYGKDKTHDPRLFVEKPFDDETERYVDEEMRRHQNWAQTNGLDATPYVLLDGHPLPSEYSVKDITELA